MDINNYNKRKFKYTYGDEFLQTKNNKALKVNNNNGY